MVGRAVLFVHLVLSPLVFSRETIEAFEYNKVALLVAAAIVLATLAPGALVAAASTLRDPLGLGVLLFTLSALVSTALSISRVDLAARSQRELLSGSAPSWPTRSCSWPREAS